MNLFSIFKSFKIIKKLKRGFNFARDPRGCDVACNATWQSHADPCERLRGDGGDTWHAYLYILVILRL